MKKILYVLIHIKTIKEVGTIQGFCVSVVLRKLKVKKETDSLAFTFIIIYIYRPSCKGGGDARWNNNFSLML